MYITMEDGSIVLQGLWIVCNFTDDSETFFGLHKAAKKQVKADINHLQKLLSKLRLDKVTQEDVNNIKEA